MKVTIFVVALVSAGLSFAAGFIGGAVLNRPARQNYDAKIAQIRSKAEQSEQAIKEQLRNAQSVVQELEKEKRQLNNELRNMHEALSEANKKVREMQFKPTIENDIKNQKEKTEPKPTTPAKKPQVAPSQVLSKPMFGIYLGETINELSKRQKISLLNIGKQNAEGLTKTWRVQNDIQNIKYCFILTYENRVMSIFVNFHDASESNFEAIDSELRNKHRVIDETKEFSINPNTSILVRLDTTDVIVSLELTENPFEDDELKLAYTHYPLSQEWQAELKRLKTAKVGSQL